MKKKFNNVYQFKITLEGAKPPIWRRIQVPETYTFRDLHVAIQDAMGWGDGHLHEFKMTDPSTGSVVSMGIPGEDFGEGILPEHRRKVAKYFSMENRSAEYVYDFGDDWEHEIQLEKILPREKGATYPVSHIPQVTIYFRIISTVGVFRYPKNIIFILWWHNLSNFNRGCFTCLCNKYVI